MTSKQIEHIKANMFPEDEAAKYISCHPYVTRAEMLSLLVALEAANRELDMTESGKVKLMGAKIDALEAENMSLREKLEAEKARADKVEGKLFIISDSRKNEHDVMMAIAKEREQWKARAETAEARIKELQHEMAEDANRPTSDYYRAETAEAKAAALERAIRGKCKYCVTYQKPHRKKCHTKGQHWQFDYSRFIDGGIEDCTNIFEEIMRNRRRAMLIPITHSTAVYKNTNASIDYRNASEGYITVKYYSDPYKRCKLLIRKDGESQNFCVPSDGTVKAYPLCYGNGKYEIAVCRQMYGAKYELIGLVQIDVKLRDQRVPFLHPNTYSHYTPTSECVKLAVYICRNEVSHIKRLKIIYRWIIDNIKYDEKLAKRITSGEEKWWLPDPDGVIAAGKCICFGYASLFAAMCRWMGIPTKIAVGRVNGVLHAWNSVWSEYHISLDGVPINANEWSRIDVTLMDTSNGKAKDFIMTDENYPVEYHG